MFDERAVNVAKDLLLQSWDARLQRSFGRSGESRATDRPYFEQYFELASIGAAVRQGKIVPFVLEASIYAWMPQIMVTRPTEALTESQVKFLLSDEPIDAEVWLGEVSKNPQARRYRHSWVALSKFLHFIRPDEFAIWDSRVAACFGIFQSSRWNSASAYSDYMEAIRRISSDKQVAEALSGAQFWLSKEFGDRPLSSLRVAELCLFVAGKYVLTDRLGKKQKQA